MEENRIRAEAYRYAVQIGNYAYQALLEEVYTTPKPGLVDLYSNGAHEDMDVHKFERSAKALYPYFIRMACQGIMEICSDRDLFRKIRVTGKAAEQAMYRATDHANTHRGLIFTIGIYCAAAGRCLAEYGRIGEEPLRQTQQAMVAEELTEEVNALTYESAVSNGEENYCRYGTKGVRGEAIRGYPSLWQCALPVLDQGIREKRCFNRVKLQVLLSLMECVEDSNIISRHNPEILRQVQDIAADFLRKGGAYAEKSWQELAALDNRYIRKNISPGGCADLLAAALFLRKLLRQGLK